MIQAQVIRRPDVVAMTGLSATTIYELEKKGAFPSHWLITPRCAVWNVAEISDWLNARRKQPATPSVIPDQAKRKSRPGRGKNKPGYGATSDATPRHSVVHRAR